ncbi:thiamine-phosphate kinase [Gammaproteobacteria bacterium]|nr:thiamine-phosphate kinase [Gammaproteobacteria bacterium]MDC1147665.1 thiamine-phosphate kinase [Gammaproteobacteria bacterium]
MKDTQVNISSEFSIIKKYLSGIGTSYLSTNGINLSIGDDCAVIAANSKLLISTDTSVSGVHFVKSMPAESIAYRSVATALSDIAAMGGNPVAFNLSLVMPSFDPDWMKAFRKGLQKISKEFKFPLIGGDLVKGSLQISVTVLGKPGKKILLRSNAQPGDILCLSDAIGHGYIGFKEYKKSGLVNNKTKPYLFPSAQINYGRVISSFASSAIDISDGIIQDLSHLISSSGVGCDLDLDKLPLAATQYVKQCLEFGDDYQLLYTVPPKKLFTLQANLNSSNKKCHTIGVMGGKTLRISNNNIGLLKSWDHFQ